MMRLNRLRMLAWLASAMLVVGCSGRSDRPPLGHVRGTVTYQGKPLATGSLVFEVPGARQAQGKIVDGKITEAGAYAADDGVPLGTARIAVFATEANQPSKMQLPTKRPANPGEAMSSGMGKTPVGKSLIPAKYNDPSTSGLTWKIEAGENNLTLELK